MVDWDGAEYVRVSGLQQWLAERALQDLDLSGVRSVLDIGCGDGRITAEIARRLGDARVVGIDPSPRMIAMAPSAPGLSFERGDVLDLGRPGEFDLVTSFNALHWVAQQKQALQRISEAIAAPGRALLVLVCAGERQSLEATATKITATPRWAPAFSGFEPPFVHPEPALWSQLAERAGFAVDHLDVDDLKWDFGSRSTFAKWCTVGFGDWTSRLSDRDAEAFVEDVVDAYTDVVGTDHLFHFMQMRARLSKAA